MKGKISNRSFPFLNTNSRRGFTVVEILVGSSIMLTIILLTLSLYMRSNKVSVDQQQLSELQHDVRAAMYFISRDIKSLGAGLPQQFSGNFIQGENNDHKGGALIETDRLTILANTDPLRLIIQSFDPGSNIVTVEPNQFELYPYTANYYPDVPTGYINRAIIILPNPDLNTNKGEWAKITSVDLFANTITFERIKKAKLPNGLGLTPGGDPADYVGGTVHFVEFKTFWLDVDGSYPGCQAGEDGYVGQPGVIYVSQWNPMANAFEHLALAQNIEDLQFQYHGDLDGDQQLDDNNIDGVIDVSDFLDWNFDHSVFIPDEEEEEPDEDDEGTTVLTGNPSIAAGIRSVRILILGKTANPFVSFSGTPPDEVKYIYGKPQIADSPMAEQADKHRRFLLESTVNVRNLSLNIYNSGTT